MYEAKESRSPSRDKRLPPHASGNWFNKNAEIHFLRFAPDFLLLLRRGDRLTGRAVTFFFAKKRNSRKKIAWGHSLNGRSGHPSAIATAGLGRKSYLTHSFQDDMTMPDMTCARSPYRFGDPARITVVGAMGQNNNQPTADLRR